jgi:hypothetical protein
LGKSITVAARLARRWWRGGRRCRYWCADLRASRDTAWQLAAALAELRRWDEAAVASRAALEAVESLVSGPRDVADRALHAAAANRLSRWAAHAFVARGALDDAVLTLENGRTRELRRQLQLEDPQIAELERLMPYAVADWRAAAAELVAENADLDVAGAALDEALARIRAVPGFERCALGADLRTVHAATADRNPVVYVNPAPDGTTLMRVDAAGRIDARCLPVATQRTRPAIPRPRTDLGESVLDLRCHKARPSRRATRTG